MSKKKRIWAWQCPDCAEEFRVLSCCREKAVKAMADYHQQSGYCDPDAPWSVGFEKVPTPKEEWSE